MNMNQNGSGSVNTVIPALETFKNRRICILSNYEELYRSLQ